MQFYDIVGGHTVAQWLRHCATSRKVAGSIPDGVIGFFHCHNPSDCTMTLGSTQPLSTRNISWGLKVVSAKGRQLYRLHFPIVLKSGCLYLLEPAGPVQDGNGIALPLPLPFTWQCHSHVQCRDWYHGYGAATPYAPRP
jgi:hypothetical protein